MALSQLTQAGYAYTLVNTLVSVVAFGRNVLFMKTLGLGDVGQVAMMQTIVMLVGFAQVGAINGAYILFAERNSKQTQKIVNVLTWGVAGLVALAGVAMMMGAGTLFAPLIAPETLVIGCFAGLATLAATWMNNLLIAKSALGRSNIINVVAVSVSLLVAILSAEHGLGAALVSILLQPLVVACCALVVDRDVRPSAARLDAETLRQLLSLGFMPFLGMLCILGSYQLERWSIAFVLGEEALGSFYLVMIYMSFFALIPVALHNVSFPRAMRALQAGQMADFRRIRKQHMAEILIYGAVALIGTLWLLPVIVDRVIPEYRSSVSLTLLMFPVVLVFTLRDSAALVLYSVKNTRPILISGVILLASYAVLLGGAALTGSFSLANVVILRGVAVGLSTAYLFWARHLSLRGLA